MAIGELTGLNTHFHDLNGNLANGYRIYIDDNETSAPAVTYTNYQGSAEHTYPIIIQPNGKTLGEGIYADDSRTYAMRIHDANDALIS